MAENVVDINVKREVVRLFDPVTEGREASEYVDALLSDWLFSPMTDEEIRRVMSVPVKME